MILNLIENENLIYTLIIYENNKNKILIINKYIYNDINIKIK